MPRRRKKISPYQRQLFDTLDLHRFRQPLTPAQLRKNSEALAMVREALRGRYRTCPNCRHYGHAYLVVDHYVCPECSTHFDHI